MDNHRVARARRRGHLVARESARRPVRSWVFPVGALVVLGVAAALLVIPLWRFLSPTRVDDGAASANLREVVVTMGGFQPRRIQVAARRPFTVRVINPDSQFHTDGGGWHQFRLERLGVDVRVPPKSERSQTFAALAPGRYEFYCDVCCGGKRNPTMQGVLEVTG